MQNTFEIIWQILSSPMGIFAAIFFFGASIFVHEYGHYLAARWRGLKIERFSIGMGPRIWGWTDKRGVVWQVSWLPIGGYVLLPQLAEMASLEGGSKYRSGELPPLSWTDKVTVAAAGAFFNILFALALGCILWAWGLPRPAGEESTTIGYVAQAYLDENNNEIEGPAFAAGLRTGDQILAIDGRKVSDFGEVRNAILLSTGKTSDGEPQLEITFSRDGEVMTRTLHPVIASRERIRTIGIDAASPAIIGDVFPGSPALEAGLLPGDEIVAVNGTPLIDRLQLSLAVAGDPDTPLLLTVERGEKKHRETIETSVLPRYALDQEGGEPRKMIGVRWQETFVNMPVPPWEQIAEVGHLTYSTISALINPNTNVGLRNLSGPIGILNIMRITAEQGFLFLLWIVVIINVNLAILNLLPLPILDGGHILFATFQKVTGRPVPPRLIASAQGAMVIFLLGVMAYVTFFDLGRTKDVEEDRLESERIAKRYFAEPKFLPADFEPGKTPEF